MFVCFFLVFHFLDLACFCVLLLLFFVSIFSVTSLIFLFSVIVDLSHKHRLLEQLFCSHRRTEKFTRSNTQKNASGVVGVSCRFGDFDCVMSRMVARMRRESCDTETHTQVCLMDHIWSLRLREVRIWVNTVLKLTSRKTEIARSARGPKSQGPRAEDALAESYLELTNLVT